MDSCAGHTSYSQLWPSTLEKQQHDLNAVRSEILVQIRPAISFHSCSMLFDCYDDDIMILIGILIDTLCLDGTDCEKTGGQ